MICRKCKREINFVMNVDKPRTKMEAMHRADVTDALREEGIYDVNDRAYSKRYKQKLRKKLEEGCSGVAVLNNATEGEITNELQP